MTEASRDCKDCQSLQLRDGRSIYYAEYGNSSSQTVILYFHGLPSSRLEAALADESAKKRGIRIIAPDRPGLGLSTRKADRKVVDYPADVAELIEHLAITSFGILAVSGGSMFALACAASRSILPGLHSVGIVAGLGPRDMTQRGMSLLQKLSFIAMDFVPKSAVALLWEMMIGKAARNPDHSALDKALRKALTTGPEADVFKDERVTSAMIDSVRTTFAQGCGGYSDEAVLVARPWGFDLAAIENLPVHLWYGQLDTLAPPAVGNAMAHKIAGATCVIIEGAAHTRTIVSRMDDALEALQADLQIHVQSADTTAL